jgi:hypothetical protein
LVCLRQGFLLEGGHWRSNKVIGAATGFSDEDRIGGLASLGLKVWHAHGPTGKAMIEGAFNILQRAIDRTPGFGGREQRYDANEKVQQQLRLCSPSAAGSHPQCHPREFFPHISQRADFIRQCMANLNNTRNDGKILRGEIPNEKWAIEEGGRKDIPDQAKWMYRSSKNIVQLTRNGLRVTQNSGKNLLAYHYDNRELLAPFDHGTKFVVLWNDANPDADAAILTLQSPRKFLGMAQRVRDLNRFNATAEELEAEGQRKNKGLQMARAELRSIQPELQRPRAPIATDLQANRIGHEITEATSRLEEKNRVAKQTAAEVRRVDLTADDSASFNKPRPEPSDISDLSADEIANMLSKF